MTSNQVISAMADPYLLEALYQSDPKAFRAELRDALLIHPQSQILKFWHARLEYKAPVQHAERFTQTQLLRLLLICLGVILLIKLPAMFEIDGEWYYPRMVPWSIACALMLFFATQSPPPRAITRVVAGMVAVALLVVLLLPNDYRSASITMALLHAPFFLWSALGLIFTAPQWRDYGKRLDFLRYNGELFIFTVLILLGGVVLSALTLGLFGLLNVRIEEWYMENVAIAGLVSAPIVASFLYDNILHRGSRLATLIANVFTPLFLTMIVFYLLALLISQRSPYTDRDFLIFFNGLLLLVLAMTIFSIAGRHADSPTRLADGVNLGLIAVTLVVNVVALSAILYRLAEWGLTPNRVVVTGANLLIFIHLLLILANYINLLRGRVDAAKLTQAVTGFLPVYAAWSGFVLVLLPLLFRFA